MMPKSWRICRTGLPLRLNSSETSSYCKSSIRLRSLISDSNGLWTSSDIRASDLFGRFDRHVHAHRLGQLQFLQFGLDRHWILRFGNDFFAGYHSSKIFVYQETVQRNHPVLCPGLDVRLNAEGLIVANQRGDGRRIDHDLKDRHAARLVNARDQQLRDDRLHDRRELDADLLLLIRRKGVHDPVHRLGGAGGVERPENQVPGFRGGDGGVDGFQIAHFTHQDHVRVLPQHAPQSLGEVRHVHADFALGDERLLVFVIIFDRVFDGDDVRFIALFIDDVDHRSQRSGLAGAGGAGHQNQPARFVKQLLRGRRQPDLLHRQHLGRNLPQDAAEVAFLLEYADTEPCHLAKREAEVRTAAFTNVLNVLFRSDTAHQLFGICRRKRWSLDAVEDAVDANGRRRTDANVQVRSSLGDNQLQ